MCVLCYLISNVHTPTIHQIPPIIHYMLSIILHMPTHHPVKTHHNSQTLSDKHILITPWLGGANLSIKHFSPQRGGSQGGWNMVQSIYWIYGVHSRSQDVLPSSSAKTLPPLNYPRTHLKTHDLQKFERILLLSLRIFFAELTSGISFLCITKNSRNSWCDSPKRIQFFILRGILNSNTCCSTILRIAKTSVTCGRTDAFPLTHPSVTAFLLPWRVILVPTNGYSYKSNKRLSKFMCPNATFLQ